MSLGNNVWNTEITYQDLYRNIGLRDKKLE